MTYTQRDALAALTAPGSIVAVESQTLGGTTFNTVTNGPRNLAELYALAEPFDARDFLVYQDERLTFQQAQRAAACLAARLVDDFGVDKGDRVVLAMRNCPQWCLAYMALTSIGAVVAPLNAWWQGSELAYAVNHTGARLAIVDQQRLERLTPHLAELDLRLIVARPSSTPPAGAVDMAPLLLGDASLPDLDVRPEDDATLLYTSGATSHPKGVLSTHRAVVSSVLGRELYLLSRTLPELPEAGRQYIVAWAKQLGAGEAVALRQQVMAASLIATPLFHVTACNTSFLLAFRFGHKLVMMYKWNPERALELIERERITSFTGVPSMSAELINSPDFDRRDIGSLSGLVSGGASRPASQVREIRRRGKGASAGYGMTETNGMGTLIGGDVYLAHPNSVGAAMSPLVELKVVDPHGQSLPAGEDGEICIKSVANMSGYFRDPEATAQVLRDGWMHTGDLGHLDVAGLLYITGRAKNVIIRGGENISCSEIESALHEHPAVLEAAVYGLPDERLGEAVAATVRTRRNHSATAQELREHLASRIAKYKIPAHIELQSEPLPQLASGKVDLKALRDAARKPAVC